VSFRGAAEGCELGRTKKCHAPFVMAGLAQAIHVFLACCEVVKTWLPAASAGMTVIGQKTRGCPA